MPEPVEDPEAVAAAAVEALDPEFLESGLHFAGPLIRAYFRLEQSGIERMPDGPALVVGNHSGGVFAMDMPIFAMAYYEHFGYDRPIFGLAQGAIFDTPFADFFTKIGLVTADREVTHHLLSTGHPVLVFPGGDYDVARPTWKGATIDFGGRTGYVRSAIRAGVPIVPTVTIGGQETQLFLARGERILKALRLQRLAKYTPVAVGFPFGLTAGLPPNVPLPAKLTSSILDPVDPRDLGEGPDVDEIDAHVRSVMQTELDRLASERRLPFLG